MDGKFDGKGPLARLCPFSVILVKESPFIGEDTRKKYSSEYMIRNGKQVQYIFTVVLK